MITRKEIKEYLIKENNGNKYISDKEKVEYYQRLSKAYIKNNKIKRFIYQYLEGDGNELASKFFNVYSSSRLCFEMYSWMANLDSILDIEFEYHLPSMKSSSFELMGSNMDVYYEAYNDITFIESKFTEAVNNKNVIIPDAYYKEKGIAKSQKGAYLKSDLYYRFNNNYVLAKLFPTFIEDIIKSINVYAEDKQDWFDVKQEVAHFFGICGYIFKCQKKINNKNIHFYNVIYDFDKPSLLAMEFKTKINTFIKEYIKALKLNISFDYDFKFMHKIYEEIPSDAKAFSSDKLVKGILSIYPKLFINYTTK